MSELDRSDPRFREEQRARTLAVRRRTKLDGDVVRYCRCPEPNRQTVDGGIPFCGWCGDLIVPDVVALLAGKVRGLKRRVDQLERVMNSAGNGEPDGR